MNEQAPRNGERRLREDGMIEPGLTDRVLIMGPTGAGKTELEREVLLNLYVREPRITNLFIDFKGTGWIRGPYMEAHSLPELWSCLDKAKQNDEQVLYRVPQADKLPSNAQNLDVIAQKCLQRKCVRPCYDELVYVANGSDFWKRAPNFYYMITGGRELYVPVVMCVQRPSWVPIVALSESDVRSTFYLRRRADRAVAEDLCGEDVPWNVLRKERYSFYEATDIDESGTPLRLALGDASYEPNQTVSYSRSA